MWQKQNMGVFNIFQHFRHSFLRDAGLWLFITRSVHQVEFHKSWQSSIANHQTYDSDENCSTLWCSLSKHRIITINRISSFLPWLNSALSLLWGCSELNNEIHILPKKTHNYAKIIIKILTWPKKCLSSSSSLPVAISNSPPLTEGRKRWSKQNFVGRNFVNPIISKLKIFPLREVQYKNTE